MGLARAGISKEFTDLTVLLINLCWAPRTLHFGKEQIFWECHELEANEVWPFGIQPRYRRSDFLWQSNLDKLLQQKVRTQNLFERIGKNPSDYHEFPPFFTADDNNLELQF